MENQVKLQKLSEYIPFLVGHYFFTFYQFRKDSANKFQLCTILIFIAKAPPIVLRLCIDLPVLHDQA